MLANVSISHRVDSPSSVLGSAGAAVFGFGFALANELNKLPFLAGAALAGAALAAGFEDDWEFAAVDG
jgi:hypothetical protein